VLYLIAAVLMLSVVVIVIIPVVLGVVCGIALTVRGVGAKVARREPIVWH
jgi:hypothetical protein